MCLFFFKSKRHSSWHTTVIQNKKDRIHKPSIPFASHPSSYCHQHNLPETPLCRVISRLEDLQSFPISYWVKSKFTCQAFKDSHNLAHCAYSIFVACTSRAERSLSVRPACELFHSRSASSPRVPAHPEFSSFKLILLSCCLSLVASFLNAFDQAKI